MGRKIFISYAHANTEIADKLVEHLERRDYEVWVDRTIKGGDEWEKAINEALNWATDVIVILTPAAATSEWVNYEATTAKAKEKTNVHPVVLQAFDPAEYPLWARGIQHHDFFSRDYKTALDALCAALGDPDPVQELLDDRLTANQKTKALLSEDDLKLIETQRTTLFIDAEAERLILASRQYVEQQRKDLYLRVLTGAAAGGIWLSLYLWLTVLSESKYLYLELAITLIASLLPGGGAGALFVFSTETVLKLISEEHFVKRLVSFGALGAISFGLMSVVYGLFVHPFSEFNIYLSQALQGILWGLVIGLGIYLTLALNTVLFWFPALGTTLLSALAFWGLEAWLQGLGNGAAVGELLLTGALLPLLMVLVMTYQRKWRL